MTNLTHLTDLFQSGWNLADARKAPPAFVSTHGLAVRWVVLVCALEACCTAVCHAEPTAAATADPTDTLAAREQQLLAQFNDLEKTFLRLADLLAASDPRRSAVLRGVFEQARDQEVGSRLDLIVQLLEKDQLLKAGAGQATAIEKLRELLDLLESGDSDRRLTNTKEEVKQFLARLSKAISRQRDIEGSTESGTDADKLADRQETLAEETQALARDIGGFAKRMDARDTDSAPKKPTDETEGQGGDQKPAGKEEPEGNDDAGDKQSGDKQAGDKQAGDKQAGDKQAGDKQAGDKQAGDKQSGDKQSGDKQAGEPEEQPDGDDEASRARRTKKRLEAAEERMQRAREQLEQAKRRDARADQEKAIEELETARAELEEILRQMREKEVERLLVQLEARLRSMLRAEKAVLAATEKLASQTEALPREGQLEAARLSREQGAISNDAARALVLVRDDGSAVAIPEALEQMRDDSTQATTRLARADVGGTTRGILQDIVANLEEMIGALEKAQREQQSRQQQGQPGGRPAEPGEQPLVDKLSELKMIRALQMRVNTRTKRFSQLLTDGVEQAEEPELIEALTRLSERQHKIERAARDIVTGRTE
ncbi:MAG: hypothetical protein NTW36_15340 [Planctomycetia bacterium]|nr:hypothetical protein [Planctomycetia bacterium]